MIKTIVAISMFVSVTASAQDYNWQLEFNNQRNLNMQREQMRQQESQHQEQMQEMRRIRWQRELEATYPLDNSSNLFKF